LGVEPDSVLIGMVARFDPVKDHFNLIKAARLLVTRGYKVRFVLCGLRVDESNPELMRALNEARLLKSFHLLGPIEDTSSLMAALDISCLSSYSEAFPNVVGEAMACGIPCVSTDVGDVRDLQADLGCVVAVRDPEALASGLEHFVNLGSEGRAKVGDAARHRIEEHFDVRTMVSRYEGLYTELANRRSR
jgi:glycosyltransferase involved in cell wall biosynthesis